MKRKNVEEMFLWEQNAILVEREASMKKERTSMNMKKVRRRMEAHHQHRSAAESEDVHLAIDERGGKLHRTLHFTCSRCAGPRSVADFGFRSGEAANARTRKGWHQLMMSPIRRLILVLCPEGSRVMSYRSLDEVRGIAAREGDFGLVGGQCRTALP